MSKKNLLIIAGLIIMILISVVMIFLGKKEEVITYKITFETSGGSVVETQIVNSGDKVIEPSNPTKEGYTFIEWHYNGKTYDFNKEVTSDIKLIAKWLEIKEDVENFIIKFNTDGAGAIESQVVEKGNKVEKPSDPVKDGYIFKGWFLNDSLYDFETVVDSNMELKANYEKVKEEKPTTSTNKDKTPAKEEVKEEVKEEPKEETKPQEPVLKQYTVTFNSNGGSGVDSQTITEGNKVQKPNDPTRAGHTFAGWTLNGNNYDFSKAVTSDITLIAKWTEIIKNNYTVTFNSNGGSSIGSQTVTEGNKVQRPSDPTKTGHRFAGWTLNGSAYDFNSAVTGNITLVANWTQKSYSVTATAADQTSPFSRVLSVYEEGTKITVKTIQYSDGTTLCQGTNPNVNYYAIEGETSLRLVLSDGTVVTASLTIN